MFPLMRFERVFIKKQVFFRSSSKEKLIQVREDELNKLQVVLSLKRPRELQQEAEELERQLSPEVGKKQKGNVEGKKVKSAKER